MSDDISLSASPLFDFMVLKIAFCQVEVQIFSYGRETHIIEPSDMTDMQPRDAAL